MVSCCGMLVGILLWLFCFQFIIGFCCCGDSCCPWFSLAFCFGRCFDSVRPPFLFFALVFVLVVLVVVVVVFPPPFSLVEVCVYEALLMFLARFFLWLTGCCEVQSIVCFWLPIDFEPRSRSPVH
jgi:hypothetical protein